MRKVIVLTNITLDGIMSGPIGDENNIVGWGLPGIMDATPDSQSFFAECDAILLGWKTYEGFAGFGRHKLGNLPISGISFQKLWFQSQVG